jgi:hypothetical protein
VDGGMRGGMGDGIHGGGSVEESVRFKVP